LKGNIKEKLWKINTFRRIVQFISFILFCAGIFGLTAFFFPLPILWTWSFKWNVVGGAYTALQLMLYNVTFPWLPLASFLIIGIVLGRSFCGWICPFGLIQDLIGYVRRKKMEVSLRTHRSAIYVKYFILAITLFISTTFSAAKIQGISRSYESALGIFAKAPFTVLSPAETLFGIIPSKILGFYDAIFEKPLAEAFSGILTLPPLFWVQFFIMGAVLVLAAYVPRIWCKYFCPVGAILALLNKFSFLGLRRELTKCAKGECRICVDVCPMKVRLLDLHWEKINDPECIYCLKCIDACPNKAIKLKYP